MNFVILEQNALKMDLYIYIHLNDSQISTPKIPNQAAVPISRTFLPITVRRFLTFFPLDIELLRG